MNQRKRKLQQEEDDGLWIQCCEETCKKWRFVKEYQDPLFVPENWFCSQNLDKKFASCDIPEEKSDNDLIESKYIAGNVVWAKLKGFPWWPAIIDNCPQACTFYKLGSSNIPVSYHVTFFEEGNAQCAWVKPENIKPFKIDDGGQPKYAKKIFTHSESLDKSLEVARSALALSNDKRLKKYSILLQFENSRPKKIPRRSEGSVKYISLNVNNKQKVEQVKSLNHSIENSQKNLKFVNPSSSVELNQSLMSLVNFSLNLCSIQ